MLIDHGGTVYAGRTQDLSSSGACLRAPAPLAAGALVDVTDLQSGRRARFEVVWSEETPGTQDGYRLGVRLLESGEPFWGFDLSTQKRPFATGGSLRSRFATRDRRGEPSST